MGCDIETKSQSSLVVTIEEIKEKSKQKLMALKRRISEVVRRLKKRWHKCIRPERGYVEEINKYLLKKFKKHGYFFITPCTQSYFECYEFDVKVLLIFVPTNTYKSLLN